MSRNFRSGLFVTAVLLALMWALSLSTGLSRGQESSGDSTGTKIQHVLLISIDGMHALDFINCVNGINGANGGDPYCPNLTSLKPTGVNYLYAVRLVPRVNGHCEWRDSAERRSILRRCVRPVTSAAGDHHRQRRGRQPRRLRAIHSADGNYHRIR